MNTGTEGFFESTMGISTDYVVLGLCVLIVVLIVLMIRSAVTTRKMRKAYEVFMQGNDAASLEDTLIEKLNTVESLVEANAANERNISVLERNSITNFKKIGLCKYDALDELGGKLSFTLCLLDKRNNGFVLNVVHSREGCYTYIKEIIDSNSIVTLAKEEQDALDMALTEE